MNAEYIKNETCFNGFFVSGDEFLFIAMSVCK